MNLREYLFKRRITQVDFAKRLGISRGHLGQKDAQGFQENKEAAQAGGTIAGNARKELEAKSGRRVVSPSNFLSHQLDLEISTVKAIETEH